MTLRVSIYASSRKFKTQLLRDGAQRKLQKAVAAGRVKKPTQCQRCKRRTAKAQLQGHHHDYRKPFDVDWLCQRCHVKEHGPRFAAKAAYYQMLRESGIIGH
jgi:hypothetical protein